MGALLVLCVAVSRSAVAASGVVVVMGAAAMLATVRAGAPEIVVVGDQRFRGAVAAAAGLAGRPIAASVDLRPGDEELLAGLLGRLSRGQQLFIDGRLLAAMGPLRAATLLGEGRLRVLSSDEIGPLLFRPPLPLAGRLLKRTVDIVAGGVGLVATLPVVLAAVLAVRLDSPGPVLFRQRRLGVDGNKFTLYKLRTMSAANDDGAHRTYVASLIGGEARPCAGLFKMVDDPRVTRVGRVLRRFSIDELPQLWNVVKGDMSLVGPRPPLEYEADLYDAEAWARLRVRPGLTGLWQVSGRSLLTFQEMVALDNRYWSDWSVGLEARILVRTPRVVLSSGRTG